MSNQDKTTIEDIPIVDLSVYMNADSSSPEIQALCKQVSESFHKYGILIIKDPRVDM